MNASETLSSASRRHANGCAIPVTSGWTRDAWSQTLQLLRILSSGVAGPGQENLEGAQRSRTARQSGDSARSAPVVTLIERLSSVTVTLSWRCTACHYGDQVWMRCIARQSGVCAVSGVAIRRGDAVYRPRSRGHWLPVNVDAMIHARAFE
ncbi:DUF3331 domain-containing protein [Paraburkholderia sp. CI2]|uniref:DUF3331 domain-containing protein n=1 Tax=Paraburkholderia sp. CI2 TaxID=2723093 RepID=UPI00160E3865|nr:DUF3331 domain-containing protein [Paraburkholderia sp. CI2]